MSLFQTTALPHISIQKIYLNSDTITVNGSLTSLDEDTNPFLMDEEYFSEFINIYFFLVDDSVVTESMLSDHSSRVASILNANFSDETPWDQNLKNRYNHHIITLKDTTITLDPNRLDIENNIQRSSISRSEYITSNNLKDINFSVEFDYNLNRLYDPFGSGAPVASSVKLFVFSHLDVQRLSEEYSLSAELQSIIELNKIGGNFRSYPVLVKKEGEERYIVPETTTAIAYADGTPYVGSYHYHGEGNEGPNNYIGLMEGPADPHMLEGARPLKQVTIPYSKVVANFLLDDQFFIGNNYNGSQELFDFLDNSPGSDQGAYNSFLPPTMGQLAELDSLFQSTDNLLASRDVATGTSDFTIYDERHQQTLYRRYFENTQRDGSSNQIIKNVEHDLDASDPGFVIHKLEFELDFKKLIRLRSKYPFLQEGLISWFNLEEARMARNSTIQSLIIKRIRLSNHPSISNNVETPIYDIQNRDEIPKIVAHTRQSGGRRTINAVYYDDEESNHYDKFTLEELALDVTGETSMSKRKFILRDYELSERINFGRYAYTLEIVAQDKIKSVLIEKRDDLRNLIKQFKNFLIQAAIPNIPKAQRYVGSEVSRGTSLDQSEQQAIDEESVALEGSFNYSTNQYTQSFAITSDSDHDQNTRDLIRLFINMQGSIGNITIDNEGLSPTRRRLINQLENLLIPIRGGQLLTAEKFLGYCQDLLNTYNDILLKDGILQTGTLGSTDALNSTIGIGARHPQDQNRTDLYFEKRIPGSANAYKQGTTFVHYGVRDLLIQNLTPGDFRDAILPHSISVALEASRSQEISNRGSRYRYLEDITRTPAELLAEGLDDQALRPPETDMRIPDYGIPGFSHELPRQNNFPADANYNFSAAGATIESPLGPTAADAIKNNLDTFDRFENFTSQNDLQASITEEYMSTDFFSGLSTSLERAINNGSGDYFENKRSQIMIRSGDSAEADYVPMTIDSINSQPGQTVKIKIDAKPDKKQGDYRVVSNSVSIDKNQAKSFLEGSNSGQTPPPPPSAPRATPSAPRATPSAPRAAPSVPRAAPSVPRTTRSMPRSNNLPGGSY